jgi:hypothetical protein
MRSTRTCAARKAAIVLIEANVEELVGLHTEIEKAFGINGGFVNLY